MDLKISAKKSVYFKGRLLFGQDPTNYHLTTHINKLRKFRDSQFNNHSTINDAMQTKGSADYATLQGVF